MKSRVQKWGNSLALRIPRPFADEANLREDSPVDISLRNGKLVVVALEPDMTLQSLVDEIRDDNLHQEQRTGQALGKEAW
ncbi:MAG TPA: AbrB/MazE/SpoVT family DNA-binding domain-containing protein [Thermoanaerobaculia bacterium]|nr:AbrB/MazE/SpoVT family DNA-binding domain-containing protein [Thermoanaerobaculia bacterium]